MAPKQMLDSITKHFRGPRSFRSSPTPLKGKKYAFTVKTVTGIDPETVDRKKYGDFLCIPLNANMLWGFVTEEGRDLFWVDYKEHVLTGKEARDD